MGDSNNGPVQLITSININSYLENVGTIDPDLPAIDNPTSVTVGTTISWAGINWVISHKTDNRLYLTSMTIINDMCSFYELPDHCTDLANTFTNAELSALVDVSYGNTSGRVFVASYPQMRGGLNYFRSNENRIASYSWGGGSENVPYWTSTLSGAVSPTEQAQAYYVTEDGAIGPMHDISASQDTYGFRPSVCIDLTLYK